MLREKKNKSSVWLTIVFFVFLLFVITIFFNKNPDPAFGEEKPFVATSQTIKKMFGKEISYSRELLNYDGNNDYIYLEFEEGGYAVFFKNTFELMEYNEYGFLNLFDDSNIYYLGPGTYCLKETEMNFKDLFSKNTYEISLQDRTEKANQLRENFTRNYKSSIIRDSFQETYRSGSHDVFDQYNLLTISPSYGNYIPDFQYFLSNPYHTDNEGTTCGAVAVQLFLGYHNYYNDRSIIADTYLTWRDSDNVIITEYNPNTCIDPMSMNPYALGSTDSFYNLIKSYVINSSGSATITTIRSGIRNLMPNAITDKSNDFFSGVPFSDITNELDNGNPVIIGMNVFLGGVNHAVVAYGYYSFLGLDDQNYDGYLVHMGKEFSLGSSNVWINRRWCLNYLWSHNTHVHTYDTYVGGSYNEIKCSTCGHRRYAYTTNILSNTEVEITGNMVDMTESVTMPDKINGRTVTKIANNAFKQRHLTGAVLPAHLTHIGNNAFYLCPALTTVTLPTTLQSIGVCAFSLSALESVYIPSNVTEIKDNAFSFCAIETLGFSSSSLLTTIGVGAFGLCLNLKRVTIPSSVVSIGNGAFQFDNKLEEVNFSSSPNLETIGYEAFASCTKLEKFIIPPSVESIGQSAFANNSSMTYVSIPSTLLELGANAFKNCSQLTIYNEHRNFPVNWSSSWNSSGRPVFWTTDLDNSKTYVLHFYKTNTNPANTTGISSPIRSEFTFGGWYTSSDFSGTQYTSETIGDAPNNTWLYAKWTSSSCIAAGSLITLADGSRVAVEDLTGEENLLVWNMITGQYDTAPILFIDSDPLSSYEIIKLTFSDNTEVKVIDEHAFFDMTIGEYVFMRNDASQYIGHYFNKQGINGTYTTVQLLNVTVYNETTTAWSPVTYGHLCYYVNGMLSMPGATEGLINIFDVDTTLMKYDSVQMAADIQTYGLYTYEEFNAIIPLPELVFNAFNGQYLKVSIGKGLITLDEIAALLERYAALLE